MPLGFLLDFLLDSSHMLSGVLSSDFLLTLDFSITLGPPKNREMGVGVLCAHTHLPIFWGPSKGSTEKFGFF